MKTIFERLIPTSAAPLKQARARVVVATCLTLGAAILALLLYWIIFSWLEQLLTVILGFVLILILAGILVLVKSGRVHAAAWTLTILLTLTILADMFTYGIGGVTSAGFVIPIALATFTLGTRLGLATALLGSAAAFAIAIGGAAGMIQTEIPFKESNLSFDAMAITIVYMLVGMICAVWTRAANKALGKLVE